MAEDVVIVRFLKQVKLIRNINGKEERVIAAEGVVLQMAAAEAAPLKQSRVLEFVDPKEKPALTSQEHLNTPDNPPPVKPDPNAAVVEQAAEPEQPAKATKKKG